MLRKNGSILFVYSALALLLAGVCLLVSQGALRLAQPVSTEADPGPEPESAAAVTLLVIDPGHGGEDGGANVGDTVEKNLNLAVSLKLSDLCAVFGLPALLTRTDDRLLYDQYDDLEDYRGQQKTYDLRNRLRMAEESGARLFLSVHMNKFPQTKVRGLQVYYAPNGDGSAEFARAIQLSARRLLDRNNMRETKAATDAIYLMNRIGIPAALVECGFLSNPEERELLQTPSYQLRLAAALFVPAAEFLIDIE